MRAALDPAVGLAPVDVHGAQGHAPRLAVGVDEVVARHVVDDRRVAANLDFRVEVAWPVYDERLKQELLDILELQWQDNTKARVLNRAQSNRYRRSAGPPVRAQEAIGAYLALAGKRPAAPA